MNEISNNKTFMDTILGNMYLNLLLKTCLTIFLFAGTNWLFLIIFDGSTIKLGKVNVLDFFQSVFLACILITIYVFSFSLKKNLLSENRLFLSVLIKRIIIICIISYLISVDNILIETINSYSVLLIKSLDISYFKSYKSNEYIRIILTFFLILNVLLLFIKSYKTISKLAKK